MAAPGRWAAGLDRSGFEERGLIARVGRSGLVLRDPAGLRAISGIGEDDTGELAPLPVRTMGGRAAPAPSPTIRRLPSAR